MLLRTRLEQAENNEILLMKKIKSLEDDSSEKQHVENISQLQLELQHKITLLIRALEDKGHESHVVFHHPMGLICLVLNCMNR